MSERCMYCHEGLHEDIEAVIDAARAFVEGTSHEAVAAYEELVVAVRALDGETGQ